MPCVAFAPDTDEMMKPHPEAEPPRRRVLKRQRGQPRHLRTIRRVVPGPHDPARLDGFHEFHVCLLNQFVSRQRRSAMRARCSMTHRLFSVMFSSAQISLLSTPSTSRMVKTVEMFFGSLFEQSRNVFQNASLSRLAPGSHDHSSGP